MALAAEMHQDDIDPVEKRKGAVTLERVEGAVTREYATISNISNRLLPAAPDRPSATQFADYLRKRGLFAVRAWGLVFQKATVAVGAIKNIKALKCLCIVADVLYQLHKLGHVEFSADPLSFYSLYEASSVSTF